MKTIRSRKRGDTRAAIARKTIARVSALRLVLPQVEPMSAPASIAALIASRGYFPSPNKSKRSNRRDSTLFCRTARSRWRDDE
jgi:hypothetical protein